MHVRDLPWGTWGPHAITFLEMGLLIGGPEHGAEADRATDPAPDIVIDAASHHRQATFLEIFPQLNPGGLHVIEDLRQRPPGCERPGITTTATLFRSWLDTRRVSHSDPEMAAAFNARAPQISGCLVAPARDQKKRSDQIAVTHTR